MVTTAAKRLWMPMLGIAAMTVSVAGLSAWLRVLKRAGGGDPGLRLWVDYGLVAVALIALLLAGIGLFWSWANRRQRDVIPGPALYLLGFSILMLGSETLLLGGQLAGVAGIVAGLLIIVVEYRSDLL